MTIHFICRGNTYRSRLAESYLKSKNIPSINVVSSGVEAQLNESGPITWYAQRIIQKNKLQLFEKPMWQQTTKELLETSDLNIFMHKDIYDFSVENLGFNKDKFEVWDIPDSIDIQSDWISANEEGKIKITEETFEKIKRQVEDLVVRLKKEKAA